MGVRNALHRVFSPEVLYNIGLFWGIKFAFPYDCQRFGVSRQLPVALQNLIREWALPAPRFYVPDELWLRSTLFNALALEEFGQWVRDGMPVDVDEEPTEVVVLDRRLPWRVDSL